MMAQVLAAKLKHFFMRYIKVGRFSPVWKRALLVLIYNMEQTGGRPFYICWTKRANFSSMSLRPVLSSICRGMIPWGIYRNQYGFWKERSTSFWWFGPSRNLCMREGEVLLTVSLDINTFNILFSAEIRKALEYHEFPSYFQRIMGDYLRNKGL